MKFGDTIKRVNKDFCSVRQGELYIVREIDVVDVRVKAAAFNAWMDDYVNNPQAYEDSHSTAIGHLTEKLNGEELSYGQICEQVLIKYLEKVGEK